MLLRNHTDTPLDFVAKESWWTCSYNILEFFNMRLDNPERPPRQFPNDRFQNIVTWEKSALFIMTFGYAATHLIPWDFSFPTRIERILWRVSGCIFTGVTVLFWFFETIAARQRFGRWDKYLILLRLKRPPLRTPMDEEKGNVI